MSRRKENGPQHTHVLVIKFIFVLLVVVPLHVCCVPVKVRHCTRTRMRHAPKYSFKYHFAARATVVGMIDERLITRHVCDTHTRTGLGDRRHLAGRRRPGWSACLPLMRNPSQT